MTKKKITFEDDLITVFHKTVDPLLKHIIENNYAVLSIDIIIPLNKTQLKKYKLNSDIVIVAKTKYNETSFIGYYKGKKILTEGDWNQEDVLLLLQQAIIQDSHIVKK